MAVLCVATEHGVLIKKKNKESSWVKLKASPTKVGRPKNADISLCGRTMTKNVISLYEHTVINVSVVTDIRMINGRTTRHDIGKSAFSLDCVQGFIVPIKTSRSRKQFPNSGWKPSIFVRGYNQRKMQIRTAPDAAAAAAAQWQF